MNEMWVALALTAAASAHCVGMCGGFVLATAAPGQARLRAFARHLLLQLGKAATYMFLGALAGAFGQALVRGFAGGSRGLALVGGLIIIVAGLTMLGLRGTAGEGIARWLAPLWQRTIGPLMTHQPRGFTLVVGMAIGFLPCPLIYAGLAAAAATGSAAHGATVMAGVALGTVPALALLAAFGSFVPQGLRRFLAHAAGVMLIVIGLMMTARGLGLRSGHGQHAAPAASETSAPAHP